MKRMMQFTFCLVLIFSCLCVFAEHQRGNPAAFKKRMDLKTEKAPLCAGKNVLVEISGEEYDSKVTNPLAGVKVFVRGGKRGFSMFDYKVTDGRGRAVLCLPEYDVEVRLWKDGYAPVSTSVGDPALDGDPKFTLKKRRSLPSDFCDHGDTGDARDVCDKLVTGSFLVYEAIPTELGMGRMGDALAGAKVQFVFGGDEKDRYILEEYSADGIEGAEKGFVEMNMPDVPEGEVWIYKDGYVPERTYIPRDSTMPIILYPVVLK